MAALRVKAWTDDNVSWDVPPIFFATTSPQEHRWLARRNGILNARQRQRLWSLAGYPDDPPEKLQLMFNREDVMRI